MRQISLCLTHLNRTDLIKNAYECAINDERISEIVIADDDSDWAEVVKLLALQEGKVRVHQNKQRLGVGGNKANVLTLAKEDWCILFDSDNTLNKEYIDRIYEREWKVDTIYAPTFARPHFDYTAFGGKEITSETAKNFIGQHAFDCFLNTGNYFVNRHTFKKVYEHKEVIGADSIYIVYQWLKAGKKILPVPEMHYDHLVHDGSYYGEHVRESAPIASHYEQEIKRM